MREDLLLEIGTEEIPARFMPGILAQLAAAAEAKFNALRIGYTKIRTLGTPRRMTLCVEGLEARQADVEKESKGPSLAIAFDADGNPTKAAMGFARGQKVDVKDLVKRDGYVYAVAHEAGKETAALLPEVLPELIAGLSFPKNMRWADLDLKFVRPIRWLVALLGDAVVPFTFAGVTAGRVSRGHRFLSGGEIEIGCAADYEKTLADAFVLVDPAERERRIRAQIEALAKERGGVAEISEDLLEEVVYLVEYPTALCGRFEEKYLALPPEAVITPMREHQRYFPVLSPEGRLLPLFITVRNGGEAHLDVVRHGNERVLRARLADAQFFYEEDCRLALANRLEKLKTVVFQEGLGTIYDKAQRLAKLAACIARQAGAEEAALPAVERAALLAKCDLVTGMVCEFTELQGVMGREYARKSGESETVAQAIYEHYLPRFAGDALPESEAGRWVGVADKLDNIVATFSRGLVPTGSQDPYALRRQALGIVHILIEAKRSLSLRSLAEAALDLLGIEEAARREKICAQLDEFFRLRLKNVLTDEEGVRYDIVDAVLAAGSDDIYAAFLKAKALAAQIGGSEMQALTQALVRVGNLAKKAEADAGVNEALLGDAAEKELYKAYVSAAAAVESLVDGLDYAGALEAMQDLTQPIDAFFSAVMVMDEDLKVRRNRLALLAAIVRMSRAVADFGKLV